MNKITSEILTEPFQNSDKSKFLEEFLSKSQSSEWLTFAELLTGKICELVCERKKKVLPLNQYEECHKGLQAYLRKDENMAILVEKLKLVCDHEISSVVANRLVYRFALKLLWEIQAWVAKKSRSNEPETQSNVTEKVMSEIEMQAFSQNLGDIFRDFFKKGLKCQDRQWQSRSACLSDKFVDGQHPIGSRNFLDKSLWFSGDEDCIVLSDNASNFFIEVESAVVACSEENAAQEVTEKILDSENALNLWYHLTSSHFLEEESLYFMKDIIKTFTRKSLLLKERQMNRAEERSVRASKAALRTHLQKNYTSKERESQSLA